MNDFNITHENDRLVKSKRKLSGHLRFFCMLGVFLLLGTGCSSSGYRFANTAPVQRYNDMKAGPIPEKDEFERAYYTYDLLVRRPIVKGMEITRREPARDVNALDDVPASSWYTPRLGYREIDPQELLRGPEKVGPPQLPVKVAKAKHGGGNPGFIIKDARGYLYLVKFDPPEFPAVETTTALIVNRLYWGFGYNVPEDYLAFFRPQDFQVAEGGNITREDVGKVLDLVAPPLEGRYRTTVSLLIRGTVLGPIPASGTRKGDINDKFAHENRRVLRALRVFNAFTNHTDMRIDNTLDVYEGEPGRGFTRHYLIDFGEAFAGHAVEHGRLWDGFHHVFSFRQLLGNLTTLGVRIEKWENIRYTPWPSVGTFEAEIYDPATWKEVLPYQPIHYTRPEDDYWAAKILGALTAAHLRTLVEAAQYPDSAAAEYVIKTLLARKEKTLRYFLSRISPLEFEASAGKNLVFKDMETHLLPETAAGGNYSIQFFGSREHLIGSVQPESTSDGLVRFTVPAKTLAAAGDYLKVKILKTVDKRKAPRPAEFHFAVSEGALKLIGVLH